MKEINKIYLEDCRAGLRELNDNSIDCCVSSPPYKDEDGWTAGLMHDVFFEVYRTLKFNSVFFLQFGHLAGFKFRPFETLKIAMDKGFELNDTFTWLKPQYRPLQGKKRVNNVTEFIFLLYKGNMPDLDRLSIGKEYEDQTNVKRYGKGNNLTCRGNLWKVGYETIQKSSQKLHTDRFPEKLAEMCLKLANLKPGSLVLDPFMGSGTTAVVAKNLGHNYIGYERQEKHWKTANERLING